MTLVTEQLGKLSSNSGAAQLLGRVQQERAAQAAAAAQAGPTLEQENAQRAAAIASLDQQQRQLEADNGGLATFSSEFGRGVLDALLAPGALVGMAAEGAGALTGSAGLEQFGRDLGQSSSGQAVMELASVFGSGGRSSAATAQERVAREIEDRQKAWPTLSAVSHAGGMIAPALAGGAFASGAGAGTAGMAALGTAEGAASGAQSGYERNQALRDVMSSALVGGILGGGTALAGEGIAALVNSKPLRAAARELAEDANFTATGFGREDIRSVLGTEGAEALKQKATDLAGELSGYRFQSGPLEGKPLMRALRTPEGIREGVVQAIAETEDALSAARQEIAAKAAQAPETAIYAEALAQAPRGVSAEADGIAQQALEAMGGDVAQFQALRQQAQNFQDLSAIMQKAASGAPSLDFGGLPALAAGAKLLSGSNPLTAVAHGALTMIGKKVVEQRSASTIAALANTMVLDNVATALGKVMPAVQTAAAQATGREAPRATSSERADPVKQLTPEQKQDRYQQQLEKVNKAATQPDLEARADVIGHLEHFPAPLLLAAGTDMGQRIAQLHADMPKPTPNIHGKAYETLSSEQVRLANAMYEATVEPMSVFDDFAAGDLDYDKVQYAWKQYPGLQQAFQAGIMDVLTVQLSDDDRSGVPDSMLTQLDNLAGFNGTLQPTLDAQFSQRMTQLMQPPPAPPPPRAGGKLDTPAMKPTFTQRLSGQQ